MSRLLLVLGLLAADGCARGGAAPEGRAVRLDPSPLRALGVGDLEAEVAEPGGAASVAVRFTSPRSDSAAVYVFDGGAGPPAHRVEPAGPVGGRACRYLTDTATGAALDRLGLAGTRESAVDWDGRPTDGGRYVAVVSVSPDGDALALLVADAPPEPQPMAPPLYCGPFAHEVYTVPELRRVVGPVPVSLPGDADPFWQPCWSPSGTTVVYVTAAAHAVAVVPGAPRLGDALLARTVAPFTFANARCGRGGG